VGGAKALKHPESKETKEKDDDKAKAEQDKLIFAAMVRVRKELTEQYRQQGNAQPDKAVYQWAMGFINVENDPQAAEAYYRAALKIDSRFAPAHGQIAILERDRGAVGDALEDMRQAVEDDPRNAEYLFSYAYSLKESDPAESQRHLAEVVQKFPHSEDAAEALYYLANQAGSTRDRIRYLETLRRNFPPNKFEWASSGMEELFEVYDGSAPEKALALARKMTKSMPKDDDWRNYFSYEQGMMKAEQLLAEKRPAPAEEVLSKVSLPWYVDQQRLERLRATAADTNGETASSPWQNYGKCASGDEVCGTEKRVPSAGESGDWVAG